jgi:hypothetical protein
MATRYVALSHLVLIQDIAGAYLLFQEKKKKTSILFLAYLISVVVLLPITLCVERENSQKINEKIRSTVQTSA